MKKETVKSIKKVSREKIPVSSLRGKVMPSRKRKLIEKALEKERWGESNNWSISDLVRKSRSYRRFHQGKTISTETLRELINLARLSPSSGNLQPLKYIISNTAEKNRLIFPCLAWAGYLGDWSGPEEGERPSAYIVIIGDTEISNDFGRDAGIAAQSILLGATEQGLGGCIVGSVRREKLRSSFKVPGKYEILLVLALGVPKEHIVIEEVRNGDIKYYRDNEGVHHVPKRTLSEIILDL
jgi:nitroreductase